MEATTADRCGTLVSNVADVRQVPLAQLAQHGRRPDDAAVRRVTGGMADGNVPVAAFNSSI